MTSIPAIHALPQCKFVADPLDPGLKRCRVCDQPDIRTRIDPGRIRRACRPAVSLAVPPARRSKAPACVHLGEPVRLQACPSCCGKVQVKVFACPLHGETTIAKLEGLHCCDGCWDYEPTPGTDGPS